MAQVVKIDIHDTVMGIYAEKEGTLIWLILRTPDVDLRISFPNAETMKLWLTDADWILQGEGASAGMLN